MKSAGIDEVLVMCVNDAAVMGAWAKDQKIEGSNISFIADPNSLVTKALGMELTAPGPCAAGRRDASDSPCRRRRRRQGDQRERGAR